MAPDWFENDDLFREQLRAGHEYATFVADHLRAAGLTIAVTPMEWRATVEARHEFADEFDLVVGHTRRKIVDVKSRKIDFTGPGDYPYPTAFVDTVSGWEAKVHRPAAIVLVSQQTNAMAVIPVSTKEQWTRKRRHDNVRNIDDEFFFVRRDLLRPIDDLVDWLREQTD